MDINSYRALQETTADSRASDDCAGADSRGHRARNLNFQATSPAVRAVSTEYMSFWNLAFWYLGSNFYCRCNMTNL